MPQLELTVTEDIDPERAERLAMELRAHFNVAGLSLTRVKRAALEPSLIPQYIQIIGTAAGWLALLFPAKWFLKPYLQTLGQRAADATNNGLAALFKRKEVRPLAEVATTLADARASSRRIEIVVGLDIPDPHFGTAMTIPANKSAEEIAYALAAFVTRAEELSATMKAEVAAGRAPFARAAITLENDGGLTVRWLTKNFVQHEKRIP